MTEPIFSDQVRDKGVRLADRGGVFTLTAPANTFLVVGDHGRYRVWLGYRSGVIAEASCWPASDGAIPHGGRCSHVAAVLYALREGHDLPAATEPEPDPDDDPFEGLTGPADQHTGYVRERRADRPVWDAVLGQLR